MTVRRIVAGILILSLLAITVSLGEKCDIDCTLFQDFTKVPDPYSCINYYTCYAGKPLNQPTPCPCGEQFSSGKCITSVKPCSPICPFGHAPTCNVACTSTVTKVNDPLECDIFYDCVSGVPGPARQCPPNSPYFNSKSNICGHLKSVCCTFNCNPVCFQSPELIPDYYNSTRYYECQTLGTPSEDFHFSCPQGQHFDIDSEICSETMPKWESSCSTSSSPSLIIGTANVTPSPDDTNTVTPSSTATTTVTPSSTATTSVAPTPGCAESMICEEEGFFPKCNYCDPAFFFCEQVGKPAVIQKCTGILLFSLNPATPYCVLPSQCGI